MGVVSFLVFGLLAGLVARALTPGRQAIGCVPTLAVGIVGAFLGGLIGDVVLGHKVRFGWHLGPFLLAVVGAVVLLLALEAAAGRRRFKKPW
ncbi:MAG TPA: GlsB/YeaQ/YmgE family stress response membrane protein [Gaiellaceae bacterium]|nr:GlsB/YeaQ/YmgE family stress response membrane protein [Gaiellaceae bacterium]